MREMGPTCSICGGPHLAIQLNGFGEPDTGWCITCRDYTPIQGDDEDE